MICIKILGGFEVPTGQIFVVDGEKGLLECLSIADYGKNVNLKADFLGLDREIERVTHTKLLPLSEKWVITISTQYGCSMNCNFCDVPKVGEGVNATYNDLKNQITKSLAFNGLIKSTKRLNIHYARMGEPTWNQNVLDFTKNMKEELYPYIGNSLIHPVLSTMCPAKNKNLVDYIYNWIDIKNDNFIGEAGLQLSINSTNEDERKQMFSGNALSLEKISEIMQYAAMPKGRKYTLNFAVAEYEINAKKLRELFDPQKFIVKLTPMHKTITAEENNIKTRGDCTTLYPYKKHEEELKAVGFDVIVFIASEYEDSSRITCGNAILSGALPNCHHEIYWKGNETTGSEFKHKIKHF